MDTLIEPTLEQCENVAIALGLPILTKALQPPHYEESMRNLHNLAAKCALGDIDACQRLESLKSAFGRERV